MFGKKKIENLQRKLADKELEKANLIRLAEEQREKSERMRI